jgi:hypothetical protein
VFFEYFQAPFGCLPGSRFFTGMFQSRDSQKRVWDMLSVRACHWELLQSKVTFFVDAVESLPTLVLETETNVFFTFKTFRNPSRAVILLPQENAG